MTDETVLYSLDKDIATIRLNRPERLNAVTGEMLDLIRASLLRAVDEGARAVLLTGEGRAFCSGADLVGRLDGKPIDPADNLEFHYNPLAETLSKLPIPVVTAVNGPAAGAGVGIALAADLLDFTGQDGRVGETVVAGPETVVAVPHQNLRRVILEVTAVGAQPLEGGIDRLWRTGQPAPGGAGRYRSRQPAQRQG